MCLDFYRKILKGIGKFCGTYILNLRFYWFNDYLGAEVAWIACSIDFSMIDGN